jgi:hypothetical protein
MEVIELKWLLKTMIAVEVPGSAAVVVAAAAAVAVAAVVVGADNDNVHTVAEYRWQIDDEDDYD